MKNKLKKGTYMNRMVKLIFLILLCLIFFGTVYGQTGKIQGSVVDKASGDPLPGANVVLREVGLGAASDFDGNFYVINLSSGKYDIEVTMIGYKKVTIKDITVSMNRTVTLPIEMEMSTIQGEEVIVVADKIRVQKDQTSTVKNISAESISALPIESIDDVISMQAGVVQGHFRGGRSGEVSYMIDGMQVNDSYSGNSKSVDLDPDAIQDMEVITGIFNAEYGRAMSGMVNIIPKEGSNKFEAKASGLFSNYYTGHNNLYVGLDNTDFNRNQDYNFNFGGPIIKNFMTFFTNVRYKHTKGHLNGIQRALPGDYSDFSRPYYVTRYDPDTPWGVHGDVFDIYRYPEKYEGMDLDSVKNSYYGIPEYYREHSGDSSFVPMNWSKNLNYLARLTIKPTSKFKINLTYIDNSSEWQGYSFGRRYMPDGRNTEYENSYSYQVHVNHMISTKLFYNLRVGGDYLKRENYYYKNPIDPRITRNSGLSPGYGGRSSGKFSTKGDLTWQLNKNHSIKTGFDFIQHEVKILNKPVRNVFRNEPALSDSILYDYENNVVVLPEEYWELELVPDSVFGMDNYTKKPYEFSAFIQDKMEFDDMTINIGFRYDYFNSNTVYPSNYRNPANQIYYPDSLREERYSTYPNAKPQIQLSPRFGLSYSLSDLASLHFAYGHFFQMPSLGNYYQAHRFEIGENDFSTTLGNPNLKAQKTVKYELGLQQELMENLLLDVSIFYKDIYNLTTVKVRETYNRIRYGLYGNKDYGNTKGLELKLDYYSRPWTLGVNYTLMYTRGNANDPNSTYSAISGNVDPVPVLIPMSWDQRHTFNFNLGYVKDRYGISLVGLYNSGTRYTWNPIQESRLQKVRLYENNEKGPYSITFDMKSHYAISLTDNIKMKFSLSVYNLFDRKNVGVDPNSSSPYVNNTTGQANVIIEQDETIALYKSDFIYYGDSYINPANYVTPREIKFGIDLLFK